MVQFHGSNRQDRDSVFVDQEGIFVRSMTRSTVLDDAHSSRGYLLVDAVVQQDHAIGNVFLQTVPGEGSVAFFGGNHCGKIAVL